MDIPPLVRLYCEYDGSDHGLNSIRFSILGWIMSIPENIISRIKRFSVWQRINCVALYALVKVLLKFSFIFKTIFNSINFVFKQGGLISVKQADAIFYTEKIYHDPRSIEQLPLLSINRFYANNIRAAHIYNIVYSHVLQNFEIAGLLSAGFLNV